MRVFHTEESGAPTTSVVVPAYDVANFISQALDSVLAQSYRDYEIIVVNDGSPDTEVLERVLEPYQSRVVYIKQENRGLPGALNSAIRAARGAYLAFLDSDDCWPPEYLSAQMEFFENDPGLDLVYSNAALFGEVPRKQSTFMKASHPAVTLEDLLAEGNQIIPSGTVARRQAIIDAGLFDESLRICHDYDMWLRLAHRKARIAHQPCVPSFRRIHPRALTANTSRAVAEFVYVLMKLDRTVQLPERASGLLQHRLTEAHGELSLIEAECSLKKGKECLAVGEFASAADLLARADAFYNCAKLKIVLFGLRTAPYWARSMALTWQKLLRCWTLTKSVLRSTTGDTLFVTVTTEEAAVRWAHFRQSGPPA